MANIFTNRTVLITGGTGYLGQALTSEILKQHPKSIRVFSRDEVKHYKFQEKFHHNKKIRNFLGDVRDYERLLKATRRVDIVIHAAALKRLDLMEYNVEESIKTNILGTLNVVNACLKNNVKKAVMISTDKACSPVNTYGACKFVSERIFTESNYSKGDLKTVFTTVRYGNVLESTGSVIPFFSEKIVNNDDIPLTDPRMTRFIISPKQAVELVFNAITYGVGGEIFVPKIPSFKITDLIEILRDKYHKKNKIKIVGIRPGEKIHELMINNSEIPRTYNFMNFYVIGSPIQDTKGIKKAIYIKKGKVVNEKLLQEYSSANAVISKDEVSKIFKRFGVI
ncbi:MAG: SDR family NAD(P)-dependent oxidoreductase [Candidatus Microgenomates bacterium]|jgi:FlaA1/EpsC-like NDP-sugar epimerase